MILFKAMMLGLSAPNYSAEIAMEEEPLERENPSRRRQASTRKLKSLGWPFSWAMALTVAVSLALGVALFFYVPLLLTQWLSGHLDWAKNSLGFNLVDGAIRIVFFIVYIPGHLPDEGHPAGVRVSRRRTQGGLHLGSEGRPDCGKRAPNPPFTRVAERPSSCS